MQRVLQEWMPQIQGVLAQGGTSQLRFTLHDDQHGYRVAERMVALVPHETLEELSAYELGLMLLSAYLHDIGMSPERGLVRRHEEALLTGAGLSQDELHAFQAWLDDHGVERLPLAQGTPRLETLAHARELLAFYARHRHNDWSAAWTRENAPRATLERYPSWIDDLILICQSHHVGYTALIARAFDPIPVGDARVHRRYLACVLRIADILEFDPERTPEVILRHRDVQGEAASSLVYWHKDHQVSLSVDPASMDRERWHMIFVARPRDARTHKAIETMADEIDQELRLCDRLRDERPFGSSPLWSGERPYHWRLPAQLHRELHPGDDYEYVDGAFRPDTRRLLELLAGNALYPSPFDAVRELLQNAFDAVREQLAWERLQEDDPANPAVEDYLAARHRVRLTLLEDPPRLVCEDTGAGITRQVLRERLLASGSAARHEILDLGRRCRDAGFELERTGRFGVGVLSYFMLAERVRITSLRSAESGNNGEKAWSFETEGVGSFGELRPATRSRAGTEVVWTLKTDEGWDPEAWLDELKQYLNDTVVRIPCRLEVRWQEELAWQAHRGWATSEQWRSGVLRDLLTLAVEDPSFNDHAPHTRAQRISRQRHIELGRETIASGLQQVRWNTLSGVLQEGAGHWKIHIPSWEIGGGRSLVFPVSLAGQPKQIVYADVEFPRDRCAYLGMHSGVRIADDEVDIDHFPSGILVEIDLNPWAVTRLTVSRGTLHIDASTWKALTDQINQIGDNAVAKELQELDQSSRWGTLCRSVFGHKGSALKGAWWPRNVLLSGSLELEELTPPVAIIEYASFDERTRPKDWLYLGKSVQLASSTELVFPGVRLSHAVSPSRCCYQSTSGMALLWTAWHAAPDAATPAFPPTWQTLAMARWGTEHYWNPTHPLSRTLSAAIEEEDKILAQLNLWDPTDLYDLILAKTSTCTRWLRAVVGSHTSHPKSNLWTELVEGHQSLLQTVWKRLCLSGTDGQFHPIHVWSARPWPHHPSNLVAFSPSGIEVFDDPDLLKHFPDPGPEWTLVPGANRRSRSRRKRQ